MSDLIYRQDALKALRPIMRKSDYFYEIQKAIQDIPPAEPERKKGKWSDGYRWQRCSLCKQTGKKSWNYCPNCGAEMRGEQNEH